MCQGSCGHDDAKLQRTHVLISTSDVINLTSMLMLGPAQGRRSDSIFVVRLTVLESVRPSERRIDRNRAFARGKENYVAHLP